MDIEDTAGAAGSNTEEPWQALLYKEYTFCEKGSMEYDLGSMIKDLLLSNDEDAAQATAHRVDAYYWEKNLDSGPLFVYQKDDPLFGFLSFFYQLIIDMVEQLRYDDSRQDKLVQLVIELSKIPPKPFTRWNVSWRLCP